MERKSELKQKRALVAVLISLLLFMFISWKAYSIKNNMEETERIKAATMTLLSVARNVNVADKQGWTPLMFAAVHSSDPEALRFLIENGADVNAVDTHGRTPLMTAAFFSENPVAQT